MSGESSVDAPASRLGRITKSRGALRGDLAGFEPGDPGEGRGGGPQRVGELAGALAFDLDLDAGRGVAHEAGEAQFAREPPDRRPEPDALHDPGTRSIASAFATMATRGASSSRLRAAVVHARRECVNGGGVARRGGLHRRSEASTMEVRSDRTPQPTRERFAMAMVSAAVSLPATRTRPPAPARCAPRPRTPAAPG